MRWVSTWSLPGCGVVSPCFRYMFLNLVYTVYLLRGVSVFTAWYSENKDYDNNVAKRAEKFEIKYRNHSNSLCQMVKYL